MLKNIFSKINLIRLALLTGAVVIVMLMLPQADHQSYSYELNQPWKYQLLTAEFDMPILRDSTSLTAMRDSVDRSFVPFVKRQDKVADDNIARFESLAAGKAPADEVASLKDLLRHAYSSGIADASLYNSVAARPAPKVRVAVEEPNGENTVQTLDASSLRSPVKAFESIDSLYGVRVSHDSTRALSPDIIKALNICIVPNVVLDTLTDTKFRSQAYLNVTGATGVIKKGQRIVDRGEIVTPQIYTNLNTYIEMLETMQGGTRSTTYFMSGQALYILTLFTVLYLFLARYRQRFFHDLRKMVFLMIYITLFVVFSIVMFEYVPMGLYLVPYAAVPVVIMVFFDSRTAIIAMLITILLSAMIATFQFQFVYMEFVTGLVASFSIRQLSRRSQLLRTALFTFISYTVCYFISCLISEGTLSQFSWRVVGFYAINAVILSFAYVLILVIEKVFGFTSTVTLVELSDINNPLLRRLAEEAPGTFQHSMQVSTLATEAARAIGANTMLVRTGALYHDIGKLESPVFFTENQHGVNPHEGLDPEVSAQKIISHVTAGLALASKEKLPQKIKDFIAQHHGRSLTRYFYNTAVNNSNGNPVDPEKFRYPGPDPQSSETAILMMADAVEAASRSLKDYSPESINALVDKIIDSQVSDGRFRESPISFRDVETVKDTFKKRLATIYHSRVAYPEVRRDVASAPMPSPTPAGAPAADVSPSVKN